MTSSVDFVIDRFLRAAFPPTIIAEIIALTATATSFPVTVSSPFVTLAVITTVHAPDNIPKISPITSLQTFDTISAFSTMYIAIFRFARNVLKGVWLPFRRRSRRQFRFRQNDVADNQEQQQHNNYDKIPVRLSRFGDKTEKSRRKNVIIVAFNAQCEFLTRPFRLKSYFVVVAMLFHKSNYDGGRRNMIIRA